MDERSGRRANRHALKHYMGEGASHLVRVIVAEAYGKQRMSRCAVPIHIVVSDGSGQRACDKQVPQTAAVPGSPHAECDLYHTTHAS